MKSGWITAISIAILAVGTTTWAGGPGPTIPGPGIDPGLGERLKEQERQKLLPKKTLRLPNLPDLVVTMFETTGRSTVVGGQGEVPVRVVVKNQGTAPAPIFKVKVEHADTAGKLYWFTVPGQTDTTSARTNAPLAAGSSVTFAGKVAFGPVSPPESRNIRAVADSCAGDEFMPVYCRVQESNEHNNTNTMTVWFR